MGSWSKDSEVLHRLAVEIWQLCAKWSIHLVSAWIPRDKMLANGSDELSRNATVDKHYVRVSDSLWQQALEMAARRGMQLSVDWLADQHNTRLPRFWSWEPSVGAEGVDACNAPSWGRTACGKC
eukprot:2695196-Rhodomonas_salina.1